MHAGLIRRFSALIGESEDFAEDFLPEFAVQAEAVYGPLSDDELLELALDHFQADKGRTLSASPPANCDSGSSSLGSWPESASADPSNAAPCLSLGWVLDRLEDQFQCAFCIEPLARPYSLNHGQCGHNFCALCVLKWYFDALDSECGRWLESLRCPVCRATLPATPIDSPRDMSTLPFIPNRSADTTVRAYLDLVRDAADGSGAGGLDERIKGWERYGRKRVDWEERDRKGADGMELVVTNWAILEEEDFIAMKNRFEDAS
ncbi:hypothetical protein L226DRAFT_362659 [Lentinus tigrinus ALCF2SS1-7]|uniref:uncharacterized protein n=1 Tax=Lentinus tigrinus ALCF2SS1-7 TaxID=1328758 RepID=UPI0011661080|nr:hypothetical protein L226DRAFT_362659 [Lentinus tigrinus ALCF2SS1-7]